MPERAYLVLATPRSGSTLLCEMLRDTGIAGHPLEHFEVFAHSSLPRQPREHFEGLDDPTVVDRLAPLKPPDPDPRPPERWRDDVIAAGTGANGVWGGKLMWGHTGDLLARARGLDGLRDAGLLAVLRALLGDPAWVLVTREDTVAQAVSLWRAVQTDVWRGDDGDDGDDGAAYSYAGIAHLLEGLEDDDAAWRGWLAEHGLEPHEVRFSELAADPAGTVAGTLAALGLDADAAGEPPMKRQGGGRSQAWAERFRAEREARAA